MKTKKRFTPDAGRYHKIDVYANLLETGGATIYLHSTKAYDTLRHAEIGAALSVEKVAEPGLGWRYYVTVLDGMQHSRIAIDPYSIRAFFSEGR